MLRNLWLPLEQEYMKGGISLAAPPTLARRLQSLPPMLHNIHPGSMSSCSKAPRGLFVLVRTDGIFTANALSPSSSLRQCPDRYSIRAGRNLPDKEFRYLRTVIVTAAVHRGFSRRRESASLTFRHRAGVSPYTSSFELAETCVFGKQSPGRFCCSPAALHAAFFVYHFAFHISLNEKCKLEIEKCCVKHSRADLIPKLRSLYCRVP